LGARMLKERRDFIKDFINGKYPQITVKHAKLSDSNFELKIEEYSEA